VSVVVGGVGHQWESSTLGLRAYGGICGYAIGAPGLGHYGLFFVLGSFFLSIIWTPGTQLPRTRLMVLRPNTRQPSPSALSPELDRQEDKHHQ
ncbi:MAG: hypothetical protein SNJ62_06325, partial [Chloracidobacterium sp.]